MSSFSITVRPRLGLHNEYDEAVIKYITKHQYHAYVHEMEHEARHIHAQIWIPKSNQDNIRKALFRIGEKFDPTWDPASKKLLSGGVRIAYNDDFVEKYMAKENKPIMNLPDNTSDYYPSKEEQAKAMAKAKRCADPYFNHLKELWFEQFPGYNEIEPEILLYDIAMFYYDQMFRYKNIAVIRDARQRKANAKCLLHYIYPGGATKSEMMLSEIDRDLYVQKKDLKKCILDI